MKIAILALVLSQALYLVPSTLFSQRNFNDYKTLQSEGAIPVDFSALTYEKIKENLKDDNNDLSSSQKKAFLKRIHYGIDNLLHSGRVVYGDEVSIYVQEIAEKLLKKQPDLLKKLRFYTVKSNQANAFSTDQGIVFVTTGMIAQLTSEAQLAYILGHEISHYTEKHVVEGFEFHSKKGKNSSIKELSIYSKEKELDADRLGLALYHDAGYSMDELLPTFDVLMYSYLPFDEVEIPKSYFSTHEMFIPDKYFPDHKYEIKAIEDYDDSKSSHPNVKNRKESTEKEMKKYSSWENNRFLLGEQKFNTIRTICRFETVRTDIINTEFADALYSIFLLEKEFPNSSYLQRMKAQSWLGLVQYRSAGRMNESVDQISQLEGEIAAVHFMLKKLPREGMFTLALRQVYNVKKLNPESKEIAAIYENLLTELMKNNKFKRGDYSKLTFDDAAKEFLEGQTKNEEPDTVTVTKTANKYDKIRKKRNIDNPNNFDSTKYYLYGLSDLLIDEDFVALSSKIEEKISATEKEKEEFDKLSYKKQKAIIRKEEEEQLNIGATKLLVVEPMVFSHKNGNLIQVKSEKLQHSFSEIIQSTAVEAGVEISLISKEQLAKDGTASYNERNALFSFMMQMSNDDEINSFPVDYALLNEIESKYKTNLVMFTWVNHSHKAHINPTGVFFSIIMYPIAFVYIPVGILSRNDTEMNLVVLDINKATVEVGSNYYFKDSPKNINLGAHMYSIFQHLIKSKSTN